MPGTPSRITYQSASDMDASIFTCRSPDYTCSYLSSEVSTQDSSSLTTVTTTEPPTTSTELESSEPPTRPSTDGSSSLTSVTTTEPPTVSTELESSGPPTEPSTSGSTEPPSSSSQLTTVPWQEIGPHNQGDLTGVAFSEIGGFNTVMGLRRAQWFLTHLMMEHESASHRLLAVSTNTELYRYRRNKMVVYVYPNIEFYFSCNTL